MIRWSLSAELLCIIILVLLMFSSHGQKQAPTRRQRVYQACLLLSLDSILLNILCVFTIGGTIVVPLWLNVLLNSLYFFISVLMCSVMAAYLFSLILEHAYSDRTLRRAIVFVAVLTLFFAAAVLWNPFAALVAGTAAAIGAPLAKLTIEIERTDIVEGEAVDTTAADPSAEEPPADGAPGRN